MHFLSLLIFLGKTLKITQIRQEYIFLGFFFAIFDFYKNKFKNENEIWVVIDAPSLQRL